MPADWLAGIKAGLPKQNIKVVPAGTGVAVMKDDYADSLHILLAVCCLVLLIACANIANLLLARGSIAPRPNLCAPRPGRIPQRLIRQSLTESVVLSVLGGIAGSAVAYLGVKAIVAVAFHGAHYVPIDATPSLPVLAFAFGLSLLTGIIFGTAPAWLTSHADPAEALRGANRSTRDTSSLLAEDSGHRSGHALRCPARRSRPADPQPAEPAAPGPRLRNRSSRYHQSDGAIFLAIPQPKLDAMYRELQDRLAHIPGVKRAALALYTPLQDNWGEIPSAKVTACRT